MFVFTRPCANCANEACRCCCYLVLHLFYFSVGSSRAPCNGVSWTTRIPSPLTPVALTGRRLHITSERPPGRKTQPNSLYIFKAVGGVTVWQNVWQGQPHQLARLARIQRPSKVKAVSWTRTLRRIQIFIPGIMFGSLTVMVHHGQEIESSLSK